MEVYSIQTSHEQIIANTKVLILWGADVYKTNRAAFSVPLHRSYDAFEEYKKAGIKVISIDPIYTVSAQEFKAEWIKIRPGSDVAMMLSMMNYLYKNNKYDKDFIEKYTYGFDKFLPYLLGKTDGIDKTTKWAEELTEIPAETIEKLADIMVSRRTFIAGNWAMQRAEYGEQADWALITLASMIGQIGLPGGGFGFSLHYEGGGDPNSGKVTVGGLSQGSGNEVNISIPASRMIDLINKPGQNVTYKGETITYPKVEFMLSAGISIIGCQPNINELVEAIRKLDTFVVVDPWWTPSAKMADIVLPATTIMERDDITSATPYSNDRIFAMKKIVEPRYESKDDYWIFTQLAKRFGKEKSYTRGRSIKDWLERLYDKSTAKKEMGISFEEFWETGVIAYDIPQEAKKYVRHEEFRKDPINNPLKTETGKIQIYSEKLASYKYKDFKGHPIWIEPTEWLGNKILSKKYPLHLLNPHPTYRIHSQLDNTWVQNIHKVQGREPIRISPNDAKKFNIKDGEIVEVYNSRGRILAGVVVTNTIRDGVVAIEEGAWYSPENISENRPRCNSGQVNVLTSSKPTSQMTNATSSNSTLVSIKKIKAISPNLAIRILLLLLVLGYFSSVNANWMFVLEDTKVNFDANDGEILLGTPVKVIKDVDNKMLLVEVQGVAFGNELYLSKDKSLLIAKNNGNFIEKTQASELKLLKFKVKIEKSSLTKNIKEVWEEHEEFYYDMCTSCHSGHQASTHTMLEWEAILQTMKGFAKIDDKEANYLLRYLKANSKNGLYEKKSD